MVINLIESLLKDKAAYKGVSHREEDVDYIKSMIMKKYQIIITEDYPLTEEILVYIINEINEMYAF